MFILYWGPSLRQLLLQPQEIGTACEDESTFTEQRLRRLSLLADERSSQWAETQRSLCRRAKMSIGKERAVDGLDAAAIIFGSLWSRPSSSSA